MGPVSTTVAIPPQSTPHFPARCVACLEPSEATREGRWQIKEGMGVEGASFGGILVTLPAIPYCSSHAAEHDAWVTWQGGKDRMHAWWGGGRMSMSRATAGLSLGAAIALGGLGAGVGAATGVDPMLGVLGGMVAFLVLVFPVLMRRERERLAPKPRPTEGAGAHIGWHGAALGVAVGGKVKVTQLGSEFVGFAPGGRRWKTRVQLTLTEQRVVFDNPDYARLFAEVNPTV